MPAFYLTLIAVLLAGIGARDQLTIAGIVMRQGQRPGVLIVAIATAVLTAAFAAWAASVMLSQLPSPARTIFAGIALAMAGLESIILSALRIPDEPTNSLGALFLVVLVHQVTDAPRFLIFGLSVGYAAPIAAGAAGALGGILLAALAWLHPHVLAAPAARLIRRIFGTLLTLAALVMFLAEFGIL